MIILKITDIITNEPFLQHLIIEEDQIVGFPRDHINQIIPKVSPPNEVTAALEGGAIGNSNSKESQCLQLLGRGSKASEHPIREDQGLPTLVHLQNIMRKET